jgi:hypothetical protein
MSKEILHRNGAAIVAEPVSGWIPQRAEFDADLNLVAAVAGERLADQHFIVAHAIEIAGVEQRDARIQRRMDGSDALAAVGGTVGIRHAHATETDGGDIWAGRAQFAFIHGGSPRTAAADDPLPS